MTWAWGRLPHGRGTVLAVQRVAARVRGQHNILAQSVFTTVVTLLIEMAGTRKSTEPKRQHQLELLAAA